MSLIDFSLSQFFTILIFLPFTFIYYLPLNIFKISSLENLIT